MAEVTSGDHHSCSKKLKNILININRWFEFGPLSIYEMYVYMSIKM